MELSIAYLLEGHLLPAIPPARRRPCGADLVPDRRQETRRGRQAVSLIPRPREPRHPDPAPLRELSPPLPIHRRIPHRLPCDPPAEEDREVACSLDMMADPPEPLTPARGWAQTIAEEIDRGAEADKDGDMP